MVIQIASIVLRVCGSLAVILGLLFWAGSALALIPIHMLLGVLVVLSLWVIGVGQALAPGGSWALAAGVLAYGVLVVVFGMRQSGLLPGSYHWVIQLLHLLVGGLAVGIGQMAAARYRQGAGSVAASRSGA
jgi:hypothetical protein